MTRCANFLFLDQSGIKFITGDIFDKLTSLNTTDFIFFISSSYFKRFKSEFKKHLDISYEEIIESEYYDIHRKIFDYYKSLIPKNKKYYLAPFSIKKTANIYGLIFGTNHPLGIYKFLNVCWKKDPLRGEANFDIDKEKIDTDKQSLFEEFNKPNKVKLFEKEVRDQILTSIINTDKDLVLYGLENGFLPKHLKPIIKELIRERKIADNKLIISEGSINVNYNPIKILLK